MVIPFITFWVILLLGREELGLKGVGIYVLIWAGLLAGCLFLSLSPYIFVTLQAVLDIVLILIIFGGDIQIR